MNPRYTTAEYGAAAEERVVSEDEDSPRSGFARDRARVLHCGALRRLAGKTQVLTSELSDIPRTRLTHSLEVAQVARELGGALGADPDIVDVAGLAHDLGHPPFGHNGEEALSGLAPEIGGFEGNAQTFRILTRLEAKVSDSDRSYGLNLTRASLDGCAKYPWLTPKAGKFGTYAEDAEVFAWVRELAPDSVPSLEAQVMDWADDVAYSVHDVDDAIQMGHLDPRLLSSPSEREAVVQRCLQWYLPDGDAAALHAALDRLMHRQTWVDGFDGSMRSMAAVKRLTSDLIGRFSLAAESATRDRFGSGPLCRYQASLVVPDEVRLEVAVMKAVAAHYVMLRPGSEEIYTHQRELVVGVYHALASREGIDLQPWLRASWLRAESDEQRKRLLLDQIASLTDASLARWADELAP